MGPRAVLWKYLEVPPLQVQELGAPDVVPCEDVLILTETEVLQPGGNLLRAPKMSCQRRRRERGQGPGPRARQAAASTPKRPTCPSSQDPEMPAAGARHPATGTARAVRKAAGEPPAHGSELRWGCCLFLPGPPSAFRTFPVSPEDCRADGADCAAEASSPPPYRGFVSLWATAGKETHSHFMWSEPPPLKKPQFLDKQKKKNQKELP